MASRLIADDILTAEDPPRLIGGRDLETGRIVFPCPTGSDADRYERVPLSRTGSLWSWTVQRFRPKTPPYAGPEAFAPYVVGYVELPDQTRVESRIEGVAPENLVIGQPLELTLVPFNKDADGTTVLTYAFQPLANGASA